MSVFICDANDMRSGLEHIPPCTCHVCGNETMFIDYCGAMCHTCGVDIESERFKAIGYVRKRANISLIGAVQKTGFGATQITSFEDGTEEMPDKYWVVFCEMIAKHYRENPPKPHDKSLCVICGNKTDKEGVCGGCLESLFSKNKEV